jgi:hypothetical protein
MNAIASAQSKKRPTSPDWVPPCPEESNAPAGVSDRLGNGVPRRLLAAEIAGIENVISVQPPIAGRFR